MRPLLKLLCAMVLMPSAAGQATELTIAVASNFRAAATDVASSFTDDTGTAIRLSFASTGSLYAQIINGAPYDVFLAADESRPALLVENGLAEAASLRTYAIGSLQLVSFDSALEGADCLAILKSGAYQRLAMANPRTAPYGRATHSFLQANHLLPEDASRVVYGANVTQPLQFVATGNATLGFIATAQLRGVLAETVSCRTDIPITQDSQIVQQGVVLAASQNLRAARRFLRYLSAAKTRQRIVDHGYRVPR